MADTTNLSTVVSNYRTINQKNKGLLSKLQIGSDLYDIKDPAVEALASAVQERLNELETHEWDVVNKGTNEAKFATAVNQKADGSIEVTYSNLRDSALTDTATTGQFITSVSQDVNGVVTTTKAGVDAANVTFTPGTGFESSSTNVQAAVEDALAKAIALKGTSSDKSSDETIAAAKKYADEKVQELAGTDWTEAAHTVSEIIKELNNSDTAGAWATMVDKLEGMSVSEKGQQGDPDYRAANADPSVVEYVQAAIQDVNATNAEGIADLDAIIYGADGAAGASGESATTNYAGDTTHKVAIKVTEVDGKITAVDVKTNDVASAQALTTLDNAAVKSVNSKNPSGGAVTLTGADIDTSASDGTKLATSIANLNSLKANKEAIVESKVNNWTASYASETLTWTNTETDVYVPVSGKSL